MSRAVEEWIGKNPDTRIPPRVHDRVRKAHSKCVLCDLPILPTEKTETHHYVALINGGEHRESNLRPVHVKCHKRQTKLDVAEKSKVAKKRQGVRGMGQKTQQKIKSAPKAEKVAKEDKPKRVTHLDHLPRRSLFGRSSCK